MLAHSAKVVKLHFLHFRLKSTDGTAKASKDYKAIDVPVVFKSGSTSQTVSIEIIDDSEDEPDIEAFKLALTCENPSCVKTSDADVEIRDDDGELAICTGTALSDISPMENFNVKRML